jgi:hypothetical protein
MNLSKHSTLLPISNPAGQTLRSFYDYTIRQKIKPTIPLPQRFKINIKILLSQRKEEGKKNLPPSRTLLQQLPLLLLLLPLKILPLLFRTHTTQHTLALILFNLLRGNLALFGFLFFVEFAQAANLFVAGVAQFT